MRKLVLALGVPLFALAMPASAHFNLTMPPSIAKSTEGGKGAALCLHNIASPGDRETAVKEVWRVLRPGGRAVISDLAGIDDYARWLTTAGCANLQISKAPATFPLQRVIVATK